MNRINRETADRIHKIFIEATEEARDVQWDWFKNVLNSLVEQSECKASEDEPICPHCGVKKIKCWSPIQFPDGEYTWECDNSLCEGESYVETDYEIVLRVIKEYERGAMFMSGKYTVDDALDRFKDYLTQQKEE